MFSTVIEVKANLGNGTVKVKVISKEQLSEAQINYLCSLRRDEAMKKGLCTDGKL